MTALSCPVETGLLSVRCTTGEGKAAVGAENGVEVYEVEPGGVFLAAWSLSS